MKYQKNSYLILKEGVKCESKGDDEEGKYG